MHLLLLLLALPLLAGCGSLTGTSEPAGEAGLSGSARLELSLAPIATALSKKSALAKKNDTVVTLDTLYLSFTSPGCPTQFLAKPLSGGIQSAGMNVPVTVNNLKGLRNWKVKVWTSDLLDSSQHVDSTTFYVDPGDTSLVNMNLFSKFSVLIARFVSTSNSVTAIEKLELLVNGVVQDDTTFASKKRIFDLKLSYKYLKVGSTATIVLRALDRASPARVKYTQSLSFNPQQSRDSVVTVNLQ